VASALPSYGQAAGPFQFHSVTPCRLIDTRIAPATILQSAVERKVPVQGVCGIPVGATAVAVNITAISPTNQGRLTLYPSGITPPFVSSINFPAGTFALNNGAIVPLADQTAEPNDLAVMPFVLGNGQVHMTLDVTGFFQ
jgi:hypothetical protein